MQKPSLLEQQTLSPVEQQVLRARAHTLKPVVMIGNKGLSETVLKEIDRNLEAHELIKIRVFSDEHEERNRYLNIICTKLSAAPVQAVGKVLVVFRKRREKSSGHETASQPAPTTDTSGTSKRRSSAKTAVPRRSQFTSESGMARGPTTLSRRNNI